RGELLDGRTASVGQANKEVICSGDKVDEIRVWLSYVGAVDDDARSDTALGEDRGSFDRIDASNVTIVGPDLTCIRGPRLIAGQQGISIVASRKAHGRCGIDLEDDPVRRDDDSVEKGLTSLVASHRGLRTQGLRPAPQLV